MATIDRDGRCVDPLDGLVSGPAGPQDPVAIGGDGVLPFLRGAFCTRRAMSAPWR
jgi:hypothetical protein